MKISIMMLTHNRLAYTKQTIESLYNSTSLPFNLFILDNGSTDGTSEYLSSFVAGKENINLQCISENIGIAEGRNKLLTLAIEDTTDWFVTLDNDVLLPKNWLEKAIAIMQADSNFGAVGVCYNSLDYPITNVANGVRVYEKHKTGLGCATAVFPKHVQYMLGLFTNFGEGGAEDVYYFNKLRDVLGYRICYLEERGIHLGANDRSPEKRQAFREAKRKAILELRKLLI